MHISFTSLPKNASVQLPTSKSISNRVLIIRALCNQYFAIENISNSNDTVALQEMLSSKLLICNANEAGTAFRFMTAFLSIHQPGRTKILTGAPRLRQRPIAPLVLALQKMGADIAYTDQIGFAPLKITAVDTLQNEVTIEANISSQFISALCLIAPCLQNGLTINLSDVITSTPYIKMTLHLMLHFGIKSNFENNVIHILPQKYIAKPYIIEADWSSATFIYCALLMMQHGEIFIDKIKFSGIQGDEYIAKICATYFGLKTKIENNRIRLFLENNSSDTGQHFNFADAPDLAIPFIVVCAIHYQKTTISGLHTLLVKESDRVKALQTELAKVGLQLHYENDILSFSGKIAIEENVIFETYNDHRIAMALALIAIVHPRISITDEHVVAKSFPDYWIELGKIGFVIARD
jgi:3-phosphoshikimate 1-carboxyvinyltransferase